MYFRIKTQKSTVRLEFCSLASWFLRGKHGYIYLRNTDIPGLRFGRIFGIAIMITN